MLRKIERFGIEAITGRRQFYFGELNRMLYADNIANAFKARSRSDNWTEWTRNNPVFANALMEAELLCQ